MGIMKSIFTQSRRKDLLCTSTIFLSPHFDDAVFSCGGLIADLARNGGRPQIATLFAAPPETGVSGFAAALHRRDAGEGNLPRLRRTEDLVAASALGAEALHLPFLDCIYRRAPDGAWLYESEASLFGAVSPHDAKLTRAICSYLAANGLAPRSGTRIYAPLGLGRHVDHVISHRVGRALMRAGGDVLFYEDFPYCMRNTDAVQRLAAARRWIPAAAQASPAGEALRATASEAYESQLGVVFGTRDVLRAEMAQQYLSGATGVWRYNVRRRKAAA